MRLSRTTIVSELDSGALVFDPRLEPDQVGVSSIDLRLGETFLLMDTATEALKEAGGDIGWHIDSNWVGFEKQFCQTTSVSEGDTFEFTPNRLILGFTKEFIQLPPHLAGRVEGKSGPARRGLLVHLTAPTIQAGWHGRLTLEFCNLGPVSLLLEPGKPICQLILEQVTDPEQYEGQFQQQTP